MQQSSTQRDNNFYRDHYFSVITALIVSIFLMLICVSVLLYLVLNRPLPQFFAEAPDGKSMQLNAYIEPNLLPNTLLTWASKAAVAAYTFDFVNYNKQIAAARHYFTEDGWAGYQSAVSGLIATIAQNQLFVNGVVSGPPVISNEGDLSGRGYVWRVQLPFLVTYQAAETLSRQNYMVVMTIVKVPTWKNPEGIGIDQFVMR